MNDQASHSTVVASMQEEWLRKRGGGWFRVLSGSMRPLIRVGDRVFAEPVGLHPIQPGDIVLFRSQESFITHRVIRLLRRNGLTVVLQKGDAGCSSSVVPLECIVGKVVAIEHKGKALGLHCGWNGFLNTILRTLNCRAPNAMQSLHRCKARLSQALGIPQLRRRAHREPLGGLLGEWRETPSDANPSTQTARSMFEGVELNSLGPEDRR